MPHKDEPDGEDFSEFSFTEPSEDEEENGDALSNLSNDLRRLHIEEPVAKRHIDIKVSSASVRKLSSSGRSPMHLVPKPKDRDEPTRTIGDFPECAPAPRGWSRAFPSRP